MYFISYKTNEIRRDSGRLADKLVTCGLLGGKRGCLSESRGIFFYTPGDNRLLNGLADLVHVSFTKERIKS